MTAKRKVGRPRTTGIGTPVQVRLHDVQLEAIDRECERLGRERGANISRADVLRELVARHLVNAKGAK